MRFTLDSLVANVAKGFLTFYTMKKIFIVSLGIDRLASRTSRTKLDVNERILLESQV